MTSTSCLDEYFPQSIYEAKDVGFQFMSDVIVAFIVIWPHDILMP